MNKSPTETISGIFGYSELIKHIEVSRAVSFDFFDTLVRRPLANPEDAFDLIGLRYAMPDFRERRRLAQAEAFRRMHASGRKEITFDDIYACLGNSSVSSSELKEAEYALELSLIELNPEIFELFRGLLSEGKTVVITSDMYLPEHFFRKVLEPYGLAHVPLFISSDCNATKRDSGELFDVVLRSLGVPAQELLHIGDNYVSDVQRPQQKGMRAFHYKSHDECQDKVEGDIATSIGFGLLRTRGDNIRRGSWAELGYVYGGAATLGFLRWIEEQALHDKVDRILFLARDGYALERVADAQRGNKLPAFSYFLGSRTAFTLAAITDANFEQFIPFFLSGGEGLSPDELLERIGVAAPAPEIMDDLELGKEVRVSTSIHDRMASFLRAYRWEILKVCRRNRRALYQYLRQQGLKSGCRVALVDVGWSGTTQEAFELAVRPLINLDIVGYYFCLADTQERWRREQKRRMKALVSVENTPKQTVAKIYANRIVVEQFFSAPHHSVIGLYFGPNGLEPVLDAGRGEVGDSSKISEEIVRGIESFAEHYQELEERIGHRLNPLQLARPLINLAETGRANELFKDVKNFDAWGSTRNRALTVADYS